MALDQTVHGESEAGAARPRPESTYRLQFHAGFTFRDATAIVPYLRDLGITHVYASPYLKARPGSTHGYDIVDHRQLNPEIGSREDYDRWVAVLQEAGLKQMLDIVPNHMGVATDDNHWWNDVLENGPASRYANYFDIAWSSSDRDDLQDRMLLPVLGDNYGEVLESGQLRLAFENGAFVIEYFQYRFPVAPRSYGRILEPDSLVDSIGGEYTEYQSILTAIGHLPDRTETDPARLAERLREKEVVKRRLGELAARSEPVRRFIEETVARINGAPGDPHSFDRLDDLLRRQCYRLAHWRVATDEINYRRFFDVNELAALSMEREEVFRDSHELILELVASGAVDALRIDHPDGLFAPAAYLDRLQNEFLLAVARRHSGSDSVASDWSERVVAMRKAVPKPLCIIVEKILNAKESLPADWPVDGTSGYEFINAVNGLFVDPAGQRGLTLVYRDFVEDYSNWPEAAYRARRTILRASMASEVHTLSRQLERIARRGRRSRDFTLNALRVALGEVIACFPVYRTYIADSGAVEAADRAAIESAIRRASNRNPLIGPPIFDFIRRVLLLECPDRTTEEDAAEERRFAGKFQQVTSPVMAKGVEDTAFYRYVRLASLNEVGGDPSRFGLSPESLHQFNAERRANWPHGLSPLSTHDTKRSEDVRARLNLLSEMTEEWSQAIRTWAEINATHKTQLTDGPAPGRNDEYLLYQTLLGAWPLEPYSTDEYRDFTERIQRYVQKAIHEAKVYSSWVNPNGDYDAAAREFVCRILDPETGKAFLEAFRPFQRRISRLGLFNSLAQTLLKLTLPGVADTYQGTELWDFSLVDPDNRRAVDYAHRQFLLQEIRTHPERTVQDEAANAIDGRTKLFVTQRILNLRRERSGLFTSGEYIPISVKGSAADHAFAFLRRNGNDAALIVVPRRIARLCPGEADAPLGNVWCDSFLDTDLTGEWEDVFTRVRHSDRPLRLAELFRHLPVVTLQRLR